MAVSWAEEDKPAKGSAGGAEKLNLNPALHLPLEVIQAAMAGQRACASLKR